LEQPHSVPGKVWELTYRYAIDLGGTRSHCTFAGAGGWTAGEIGGHRDVVGLFGYLLQVALSSIIDILLIRVQFVD